jgi:hypothetical protein
MVKLFHLVPWNALLIHNHGVKHKSQLQGLRFNQTKLKHNANETLPHIPPSMPLDTLLALYLPPNATSFCLHIYCPLRIIWKQPLLCVNLSDWGHIASSGVLHTPSLANVNNLNVHLIKRFVYSTVFLNLLIVHSILMRSIPDNCVVL